MRGERVGIVGPIGAGKTVLARLLAGDLQPTAGERWAGPSISVEYVSQAATELPGDRTPIDVVRAAQPLSEGEAVSLLVRFLFDYEQLRRPIASMSGGERTRLRCCLVMLSAANCLILDEPTNHLDIPAVETLEAALESYDGTVIAVSHDRYFLERIADRVLEVGGGRVSGAPLTRVRVGRLAPLEGEDARVLDDALADLDRAADRLVGVPRRGPGHHDRQVRRAAPRCSPTSPSSTGTTGCGRPRSSAGPRRRVTIGSANEVGRAHSKAIPSSQETSTNSVPGRKRPRSSFITNISGASVSCRMQLTTTSCSARTSTSGAAPAASSASVRLGFAGSRAKWRIRTDGERRGDGRRRRAGSGPTRR